VDSCIATEQGRATAEILGGVGGWAKWFQLVVVPKNWHTWWWFQNFLKISWGEKLNGCPPPWLWTCSQVR